MNNGWGNNMTNKKIFIEGDYHEEYLRIMQDLDPEIKKLYPNYAYCIEKKNYVPLSIFIILNDKNSSVIIDIYNPEKTLANSLKH